MDLSEPDGTHPLPGLLAARRWRPAAGPARRLAVLCHGYSETPERWAVFAREAATLLPGLAFAAVEGPEPMPHATQARRWWDYADKRPGVAEAGVRESAALLEGFVAAELAQMGLAPGDCMLVGFSQGAMVALHLGLRMAAAPACILSFAGRLVESDTLGEVVARPPVLLVHGSTDIHVPPTECARAAETLRSWGVPVETKVLEGVGHVLEGEGIAAGIGFLRAHG
jgi:phospholipase/carboxylesterase